MRGFTGEGGFTMLEHGVSELIVKGRLTLTECQVLHLVLRASVGWQREGVNLSYQDIADGIDRDKSQAIAAVKGLAAKNILVRTVPEKRGCKFKTGYQINHEPATWLIDMGSKKPARWTAGARQDHDGFADLRGEKSPYIPAEDSEKSPYSMGEESPYIKGGKSPYIGEPQTVDSVGPAATLKKVLKKEERKNTSSHERSENFSSFVLIDSCEKAWQRRRDLDTEELRWQCRTYLQRQFGRLSDSNERDLESFLLMQYKNEAPPAWVYIFALIGSREISSEDGDQRFPAASNCLFFARNNFGEYFRHCLSMIDKLRSELRKAQQATEPDESKVARQSQLPQAGILQSGTQPCAAPRRKGRDFTQEWIDAGCPED